VFEPDEGGGRTYAEMSKDEKNAVSHRGRALAKVCDFLEAYAARVRREEAADATDAAVAKRAKPHDDRSGRAAE